MSLEKKHVYWEDFFLFFFLLIANTLGWSEQEEPEDPKELVTFSQSYLQKPFATFASYWPCLLNELNYNKFIMLASAKLIREWVWTFREAKNCNTETNQWKKFSPKKNSDCECNND